ncbi:MAG: leucine--tRNA ligase [Flavobacteriales bacterium]|nr:leucine--tRNA ligase [Flavobacteriales bacterium]
MQYDHKRIEQEWRDRWKAEKTYHVENDPSKPKYYVLDMFPYPSGAGLHVGHPLGYIASDIVARYKRHSGFNVLHPMGYDSFGLPAEQYAIQTGQHPAKTTEINLARYREQLDRIGFSFDWDREVRTSDPNYYKWTQWIFLQLFDSWYDTAQDKARPIAELIARFEERGCKGQDASVLTGDIEEFVGEFDAAEWKAFDERTKQLVLQYFRLAYLSDAWVNWCPALGTVLANDEVKDGVSERGGHPVERKKMRQWSMRITAYAQRLLNGLDDLDWSTSLKESQRNWIGRSEGALVRFALTPNPSPKERGGMPSDPQADSEGKRNSATERPAYLTADFKSASELQQFARDNRKEPTEAEDRLWQVIRGSATGGRIRRQHAIDKYIVDFVSLPKQLVIEVDGDIHEHQEDEDSGRTHMLQELGFEVIRFTNQEVMADAIAVRESIIVALSKRPDFNTTRHSPLSSGEGQGVREIEVFTTRPDTLFGVSFLTLAPEHELVSILTTDERRAEVEAYVKTASNRSERDRQAEVDKVSGVFTGSYAKHPFTGADVPIWVGDYVLAGYGTGAVMAVPGGDQRDWRFAKHFGLPIIAVTEGADIEKEADERKDATICSEGFLKGLKVPEAITRAIQELEKLNAGEGRINFRLRDAAFGRQRYWGEPIPVYYKDDIPYAVKEEHLPLILPEVDKFLPTEDGEPPLARATDWHYSPLVGRGAGGEGHYPLETTTMPGWAGSSWYFLRYMDPKNEGRFASPEAIKYWGQVDLYMGGSEHATGHLLYFRFWTKFLHDRGWLPFDEPAKKLVNQGMIQGVSQSVGVAYVSLDHMVTKENRGMRIPLREGGYFEFMNSHKFLRYNEEGVPIAQTVLMEADAKLLRDFEGMNRLYAQEINVPVQVVVDGTLNVVDYMKSLEGQKHEDAVFVSEAGVWHEGKFTPFAGAEPLGVRTKPVVEKMSKSKLNVVNPDEIISKYGADTLRLYEMFLGPLEQSKPWDTNGIEGTFRFLRKFWNLFRISGDPNAPSSTDAPVASTHRVDLKVDLDETEPTKPEFKALHATLKKVTEDIEHMSFNTSVSQFMIAVNELGSLKCHKRHVLEPLTIALAPFAPHIAEELWHLLGHKTSVTLAPWPKFDEKHLVEDNFSYPISFNGKTRMVLELPASLTKEEVEAIVLANPEVQQRLEGNSPKKVIVVPKRIVNIVV